MGFVFANDNNDEMQMNNMRQYPVRTHKNIRSLHTANYYAASYNICPSTSRLQINREKAMAVFALWLYIYIYIYIDRIFD